MTKSRHAGTAIPFNAAERQVIQTLQAAEDVAAEIERLRRLLRRDSLSPRQRSDGQGELIDALDRLTNLLGVLSGGGVPRGISTDFQQTLDQGVTDLRERVFTTGIRVLESKLGAIQGEAADVLEGRSFYRIGLADRMRGNVRALALTIEGLGGRDGLPTSLRSCLDTVEAAIDQLMSLEEESGLLQDFA